jgi:UDP-GlcNAc:undecaprenyl-phosphate GlcNAc-1-phosphate transferase
MTTYFVSFLIAFLVCATLTPGVLRWARAHQTFDGATSHRKVHAGAIPRLGGVAIVAAFYAPLVGLSLYETRVGAAVLDDPGLAAAVVGGGLAIAALGLFDDLRQASPRLKLVVQIGAALAVAWLGLRIQRVDLPFLPMIHLGWLAWPITVLWIVGVTNAVNLIDGLDGLAAGMALFGLLPMLVLALVKGNLVLALIACCLAGSLVGFLVWNFHPARIFMGDSGSMFLGFILAVVSVATASKGRVAVALATPVLALGLPILDTMLAIGRRAWSGQSLFIGDRKHLHHLLLDRGHSHRGAVLVLYAVAAAWALLGLGVHFNRDRESAVLFVLALAVAALLFQRTGLLERAEGAPSAAAVVRARNLSIRATTSALVGRLDVDEGPDALVRAVLRLAQVSGCDRVEVELRGQDATTVVWNPHAPAGAAPVRLDLRRTDGRPFGEVRLWWGDEAPHEPAVPGFEAAIHRLADRALPKASS